MATSQDDSTWEILSGNHRGNIRMGSGEAERERRILMFLMLWWLQMDMQAQKLYPKLTPPLGRDQAREEFYEDLASLINFDWNVT